jgi:hypothetical protein
MPTNNVIYIFYEGKFDKTLLEGKIKKEFERRRKTIHLQPYSEKRPEEVNNIIKSFNALNDGSTYILLADNDRILESDTRIKELIKKFPDVDSTKIALVIQIIEGWYLAGLSLNNAAELNIDIEKYNSKNSSEIKKFEFLSLQPANEYVNDSAFYSAVARKFNFATGIQRNDSLNTFFSKYLAPLPPISFDK